MVTRQRPCYAHPVIGGDGKAVCNDDAGIAGADSWARHSRGARARPHPTSEISRTRRKKSASLVLREATGASGAISRSGPIPGYHPSPWKWQTRGAAPL